MVVLDGVQARLVGAMGELATLEEDLPKYDAKGYARITAEDVAWLEEQAHILEKECDIRFKGWARPGKEGSLGSAYLDLARSVCRRAERRVVAGQRLEQYKHRPVPEPPVRPLLGSGPF